MQPKPSMFQNARPMVDHAARTFSEYEPQLKELKQQTEKLPLEVRMAPAIDYVKALSTVQLIELYRASRFFLPEEDWEHRLFRMLSCRSNGLDYPRVGEGTIPCGYCGATMGYGNPWGPDYDGYDVCLNCHGC